MSKKKSKATRKAESQRAAERAAQVRREHEAKERRRRNLLVTLGIVAALVLIAGVVAAVQASRDTTGAPATPPRGAVDTYALPMGEPVAPVTVDVYEDFLCPFCGEYEESSSEMLKAYAASGDVQVRYRAIAILDSASSTDYSTRAANAMAVVLDRAGADAAVEMHDLLFENQPEEGSAGLSDDELVGLAVEAGATAEVVREPTESRAFEQWVTNATDAASDAGYTRTPTVLVDGEEVEGATIEELVANTEAAIEDAL